MVCRPPWEASAGGLAGEQLVDVAERLELERIAGGVEQEHRRLLARLAGEADVRCDLEGAARRRQPVAQRLPRVPAEDEAEVRHRHGVTIDRIPVQRRAWREMGDELVAVEVEIDPRRRRPPLAAAEHAAVEGARAREVVDGKGKVEARHHFFIMARRPGLLKSPNPLPDYAHRLAFGRRQVIALKG